MGYTTEFDGELTITPPLNEKQRKEMNQLAEDDHHGGAYPSNYCQWVVDADGATLGWDGGEKFYAYVEWLRLICRKFDSWGVKANGHIRWRGESFNDLGTIKVLNNVVTTSGEF